MRDQFHDDRIVLENALAFWVHRFYQATRRDMYRAFEAQGMELTPEQWQILVRLWECDGRTQSELCEATTRDPPTMSRILDSMTTRGLLTRSPDPNNGRTRIVRLTAKGQKARKTLVPVVRTLVERLEAGIPERDLEITRRTLQRLVENVEG